MGPLLFTQRKVILVFLFLLIAISATSQTAEVAFPTQSSEVEPQKDDIPEELTLETISLPDGYLTPTGDSIVRVSPLKKLTLTGYYRFFGYGRNMTEPYPNLAPYERSLSVGDGYREPMLSMLVIGRPSGKASFMTELFFFTPYNGNLEGNAFTMNLGLNFYGNFRTKFGKFGIRAGGIHWHSMSSVTMGIFQAFDLYSIFDRTPWEPVNNTERYEAYYNTGSVSVDTRWNNRAFQGIIVEGGSLPGDISFSALFGKAQPNGGLRGGIMDPFATVNNFGTNGNLPSYRGFAGFDRALPSSFSGLRLKKDFGKNFLAYNTVYSRARIDSIKPLFQTYAVHTLEFNVNAAKVNISGELGAGNFGLPGQEVKWGEVALLKAKIPAEYTFLPIELQLYQVDKNFYNDNGEILTTSNPEIQGQTVGVNQAGQVAAGGPLTQVGQLSHNRRGINIFTEKKVGPFNLKAGLGLAMELDTITNELSYVHRINGLALSRIYNPFPAGATGPTVFGPYNRMVSFFRGAYEIVKLTDIDPGTVEPLTRKHYQAFDVQAKYRTDIGKRPLYVFYLGSWMAAHPTAKLFPTFNRDAYLQAQYHELDIYYELFPKFILTGYYGLEYIRGGFNTEWGIETAQPRNQLGQGIGIGFDWTVAENAAFFVRQRFMNFEDRSFTLDKYQGNEITIELKVFF
jgi:hypothetical protein